jgi:hypothetical protein
MEIIFKHFLLKILIFSIIIILLSFAFFYFFKPEYYFPFYPALLGIFAIMSILIHRVLLKSAFNNPRRFTNTFMLTIMSKMFFYLCLSASYFYINPQNSKIFILCVLVLYIFYSGFEIYLLLNDLKDIDKIRN